MGVTAGDADIGMAEHLLNDDQCDAFVQGDRIRRNCRLLCITTRMPMGYSELSLLGVCGQLTTGTSVIAQS